MDLRQRFGRPLRLAVIGGGPDAWIGRMHRSAAALGFRVEDQVIELSGICGQCQKELPGAGARADGE